MKSLKKPIITIVGLVILLVVIIALAGMYKFNVLGDDIYVEDESEEIVKFNDLSEEQKAYQYDEDGLPPRESEAKVYGYICTDTSEGTVVYGVIPNAVLLTHSGITETLFQKEAASGAKYANEDESLVFYEKDGEAFIQIDGAIAHTGCLLTEVNFEAEA